MALYSFGYQGKTLADFKKAVESLNGIVVDVRLRPFSKDPDWNMRELRIAFARYVWAEGLGNVNYKGDGPVLLKDPDVWYARIEARLKEGENVILMCACASRWICHRKDILEELNRRTGAHAQELLRDPRPKKPEPPTLF